MATERTAPRQGRHRAMPRYLPSSGRSWRRLRGTAVPRGGDSPAHTVPSSISPTPQKRPRLGWRGGGCVFQRKNSSESKPQRKAPERAIPNASDSFINDGPRIPYDRRVGLFTPLAGRRHVPGKLAREQSERRSISHHPPRQALARCSRVCFRHRQQRKICDLQSCKESNCTSIGAQGGRSPAPRAASARAALLRAAGHIAHAAGLRVHPKTWRHHPRSMCQRHSRDTARGTWQSPAPRCAHHTPWEDAPSTQSTFPGLSGTLQHLKENRGDLTSPKEPPPAPHHPSGWAAGEGLRSQAPTQFQATQSHFFLQERCNKPYM